MTRFVVFEPPAEAGGARAASERAVFVRDAFSLWAFLFPPIWLLRYGLPVSAALAFVVSGGLGAMARAGAGLAAVPLLALLGILVALEGPSLRAWRLRRRRYRETAAIEARDAGEAAILYYHAGEAASQPRGALGDAGLPWWFETPAAPPAGAPWWRRSKR